MKTFPTELKSVDLDFIECDDYISDGDKETTEIAKAIAIRHAPKLSVTFLIVRSLRAPEEEGTTFTIVKEGDKTIVALILNPWKALHAFDKWLNG